MEEKLGMSLDQIIKEKKMTPAQKAKAEKKKVKEERLAKEQEERLVRQEEKKTIEGTKASRTEEKTS